MNKAPKFYVTLDATVAAVADALQLTLDSLRAQTLAPERIEIVMPAAPSERLTGAVASLPQSVTTVSEPAGLLPDCGWRLWIGAGAEWRPWHLEHIAGLTAEHPEAEIVWWDEATVDDDGWMSHEPTPDGDDDPWRSHLLFGALEPSRCAVRSDIVPYLPDPSNRVVSGAEALLARQSARICKLHGEPMVINHLRPRLITKESLDAVDEALCRAGREDLLGLTRLRRAIAAGYLSAAGSHREADRLMQPLLAEGRLRDALRLRAVYMAARYGSRPVRIDSMIRLLDWRPKRRPLRR